MSVQVYMCVNMYVRVCAFNGYQLQFKKRSCCLSAPLSLDHGSRGRQRALRASFLTYRMLWGKQVKAGVANPKEQPS